MARYNTTVASVFKANTDILTIHIELEYHNKIKQLAKKKLCTNSIVLTEIIYSAMPRIATVYTASSVKVQKQYMIPVPLIKEVKLLAVNRNCKLSDIVHTCLVITDWDDVAASISNLLINT